jgi:hypothetical protein
MSLNWGDVATWAGATGALTGVAVGLFNFGYSLRRQKRTSPERRESAVEGHGQLRADVEIKGYEIDVSLPDGRHLRMSVQGDASPKRVARAVEFAIERVSRGDAAEMAFKFGRDADT